MIVRLYVGQQALRDEAREENAPGWLEIEAVQAAEDFASEIFGGWSRSAIRGGWRYSPGNDHVEESHVWEIVTDDTPAIDTFAAFLARTFRQETVLVVRIEAEHKFIA